MCKVVKLLRFTVADLSRRTVQYQFSSSTILPVLPACHPTVQPQAREFGGDQRTVIQLGLDQFNAVQRSAVHNSAVQCSAVQCSAVQCCDGRCQLMAVDASNIQNALKLCIRFTDVIADLQISKSPIGPTKKSGEAL